jgi:uncharacterized membrane protein
MKFAKKKKKKEVPMHHHFSLASVIVAVLPQWVIQQLSPFVHQLFSLDIDDIIRFV